MTRKLSILFVALIFLGFSTVACNKTIPLENPNLEIQSSSSAKTGKAVKKALQRRRWVITKKSKNSVTARYSRGRHQAVIRVTYSASRVSVKLLSSKELLHGTDSDGNEVVHKVYGGWMRHLENDIYRELSYL